MSSLPKGYRAAGLPRHDRPRPSRHGLAFFYSETPASAAGVFTTNQVKCVHIPIDQEILRQGVAQAIMVNSGCANCCTGEQGVREARQTMVWASEALGIPAGHILIASTGVIGDFMPMDLLSEEIPLIGKRTLSDDGATATSFHKAAEAIMTTDTVAKISHATAMLSTGEARIWACCKGAGMIHPKMSLTGKPANRQTGQPLHATMLGFILTDVKATPAQLRALLAEAVDTSFNRVTVDGDMSTNDSVFLLANGASGASLKTAGDRTLFAQALHAVSVDLAKKIAKDGEGASKFIEIAVEGARTVAEANRMAEVVATSPLVKTAAYGEDSNWGRTLAAMGRSGVTFDPSKVDIFFGDVEMFHRGAPASVSPEKAREALRGKEIAIRIRLNAGKASGVYWTCDFTGQYVDINARYRS